MGRHERLYAVADASGTPDEGMGLGADARKWLAIACARQPQGLDARSAGDGQHDRRAALSSAGGRFGRALRPKQTTPLKKRPRTRRSEADHWCHSMQGATRRPKNAKPFSEAL
jgi:hypothetical protein